MPIRTDKSSFSKSILFVTSILFWFAQYAYTPYVNPQLITMGVTATVMGFIGGAYGFTQFLLRIPVGISADKWQNKFFICAGCFFAGLAALCMFVFHTPAGFLAGRALGGVSASAWVPFTVLYSSYHKPEHATKSITIINMGNQVGRLIAFFMAGQFAASFGPQSTFLLSAIGGFIGFAMSLFINENKAGTEKKVISFRELIAVGKERTLLVTGILCVFVQLIAFATFSTFTANHAVYLGASPVQLANLFVALLAPGIISNFLLGKFILQRVDAKHLIVVGFFLTVLYCLFVPFTETITQLYIVQMVGGVGNTLTFSLLMGVSVQNVSTEKRGAAMGFFQSIYGIGMMIGPPIMGLIATYGGLNAGFFTMAGIAAISTFAAALLLRKRAVS